MIFHLDCFSLFRHLFLGLVKNEHIKVCASDCGTTCYSHRMQNYDYLSCLFTLIAKTCEISMANCYVRGVSISLAFPFSCVLPRLASYSRWMWRFPDLEGKILIINSSMPQFSLPNVIHNVGKLIVSWQINCCHFPFTHSWAFIACSTR